MADTLNDATQAAMGGASMPEQQGSYSGFGSKIVNTFSGVNTALSQMVKHLREAQSLTAQIKKDSDAIKKNLGGGLGGPGSIVNVGGVGSGGSMNLGLGSFSGGGPAGGPPAGTSAMSGWSQIGAGALKGGLVMGGLAYATLPAMSDVMAVNRLTFNSSMASPLSDVALRQRVTQMAGGRMLGGVQDAYLTSAQMSMYGYGIGTGVGNRMFQNSANFGYLTGQNPAAVAQVLGANATAPDMGNRLRLLGIHTWGTNGRPQSPSQTFNQLYNALGYNTLSKREVSREIMPGSVGYANLSYYVPDPAMRQYAISFFQARAKGGGAPINFDKNQKDAINAMSGGSMDAISAQGKYNQTELQKVQDFADAMNRGAKKGYELAGSINELTHKYKDQLQALAELKGGIDTFFGTKPGEGILGALSGFMDALKNIFGGIMGLFGLSRLGGMLGLGGGAAGAAGAGGAAAGGGGLLGGAGGLMGGALALLGKGAGAAGLSWLGGTAITAGTNAWGKDSNELGPTGGGPLGMLKGFGNVMARAGVGAGEGATVAGPIGAVVGSILEGGYGIYQGFTDPNFNVKGHENNLILGDVWKWLSGGHAAGGEVRGPGGPTSDSIPAWLSDKEYVINATSAGIIGRRTLDALNRIGNPVTIASKWRKGRKTFGGGGQGETGGKTLDGWPALYSNSSLMSTYNLPGVQGSYLLRKDYAPMLLSVVRSYNDDPSLGPVREGYGWRAGDAYYGNGITNHMAGVVVDLDWDYWGFPGGTRTPTAEQTTAIKRILSQNPGIEWGGSWTGRWNDPMHWEVRDPSVKPSSGGSGGTGAGRSSRSVGKGRRTGNPTGSIYTGYRAMNLTTTDIGMSGVSFQYQGLGELLGSKGFETEGYGLSGAKKKGSRRRKGGSGYTPTSSDLINMLQQAGFEGDNLREAWAIAMRESGGNPKARSPQSGTYPNGTFDAGLFQFNSGSWSGFGIDPKRVFDGQYAANMAYKISRGGRSWYPWGLDGQGNTDARDYGWTEQQIHDWITAPYQKYYAEFPSAARKAGLPGYSQGAWSIEKDQTANIHVGEMILPASVATTVRDAIQRSYAGQGGGASNVTINVSLSGSSDAQATRFAQQVKKVMDGHATVASIGST